MLGILVQGEALAKQAPNAFFAVPKDFSRTSASTRAEALANASARPELSGIVRVWSSLPWVDLVTCHKSAGLDL